MILLHGTSGTAVNGHIDPNGLCKLVNFSHRRGYGVQVRWRRAYLRCIRSICLFALFVVWQ